MTQFYISPTGNNGAAGTSTATAWLTIQKAGSAGATTVSGDTVNVLDGTYNVSQIVTTKSGLTWKSQTKWGAVIVGSATAVNSIAWNDSGNSCVFDGFDISTTGRLGILCNGDDCEVKNCYVHDIQAIGSIGGSGGSGICTNNGARFNVHHNLVARIETARVQVGVQGIYPANVSCSVWNNIVIDVSQYGIHQWHGASNGFFYNNLVLNCKTGCFLIGGDGTGPGGVSTANKVYNNIIGFSVYGIREYAEVGGVTNNAGVTSSTMRNNVIFGCSTPVNLVGANSTESGRISCTTATVRFVSYAADGTGNYHLSSGSVAIGVANTTYVPTTDFDNVARPQGGTYDAGPYEFVVGDSIAPLLTAPAVTVTGTTTASCDITTDTGEGRIWCFVSTNATELAAAIIAGAESAGLFYDLVSTGLKTFFATGLSASTTYYAHYMHDDASSNRSAIVNSVSFTTNANPGTNIPIAGGRWRKIFRRK